MRDLEKKRVNAQTYRDRQRQLSLEQHERARLIREHQFTSIYSTNKGWHRDAACAGTFTPDDWYAHPHTLEHERAIRVCRGCPVRVDCALAGLSEPCGTWGGLTDDTLAGLRAQVRRHRPPEDAARALIDATIRQTDRRQIRT